MDSNLQYKLIGAGVAIFGIGLKIAYDWSMNKGTIKIKSFKFKYTEHGIGVYDLSEDPRKMKIESIRLYLELKLRNTSKKLNKSIYDLVIINRIDNVDNEYSLFETNNNGSEFPQIEISNLNFEPSYSTSLKVYSDIKKDFDDFPTGKWYLKYRVGRKTKLIDLKNLENNINSKYS